MTFRYAVATPAGRSPGAPFARLLLTTLMIAALLLGATSPSLGHERDDAQTRPALAPAGAPCPEPDDLSVAPPPARPGAVPVPAAVALVVTMVGLVAAAGSRRWAITALGAALAVMLVEAGVHSVHHLDNPEAAQRCVHVVATPHLVGPAPVSDDGPAWLPSTTDEVPPPASDRSAVSFRRTTASRAPPGPTSIA
jgi:hypothetical protein